MWNFYQLFSLLYRVKFLSYEFVFCNFTHFLPIFSFFLYFPHSFLPLFYRNFIILYFVTKNTLCTSGNYAKIHFTGIGIKEIPENKYDMVVLNLYIIHFGCMEKNRFFCSFQKPKEQIFLAEPDRFFHLSTVSAWGRFILAERRLNAASPFSG